MSNNLHEGRAGSPRRRRALLVVALLAGPIAVMVAAVIAYNADWRTIQAHRSEMLLGLVPAAFALAALLVPARWSGRIALLGGVLLMLLSLISSAGIFFLPTAILMILAGRTPHRGFRPFDTPPRRA